MARTKTTAVLVKLSEEEKQIIDAAARSEEAPTGAWIRRVCLRTASAIRAARTIAAQSAKEETP